MSTTESESVPAALFDDIPLATLEYFEGEITQEHNIVCMSALPRAHYKSACEIGCAIGLMTEKLARRCDEVLAIDSSEQLLEGARKNCKDLPHVEFARMTFPDQRPDRRFELILFADLGYLWTPRDLEGVFEHMIELLEPGGHLMMSHELQKLPKLPTSGGDVHDLMIDGVHRGNGLKHLARQDAWIGYDPGEEVVAKAIEAYGYCPVCGLPNSPRLERHRIDVFERV